ncbi:MAG: hypothetical protein IKU90_03100 [Clostridia bacterium]|nr:hypothetical protein [Clostridia bacterium]
MHDGHKVQDSFNEVLQKFAHPDSKFAPYLFWFYDQDLTTLGIKPREMAHELAKKGFNPGYAHARQNYARDFTGLCNEYVQPLPPDQWLSDAWFAELDKQARQATVDGTHACYADEYAWPSLQAARRLVVEDPTLLSRNLRFDCIDLKQGETAEIRGCFFAVVGRVEGREPTSYVTRTPGDGWQISRASFDQSPPDQNNTQPINLASAWSEAPDASLTYHLYVPKTGKYTLSACWNFTGNNTNQAVYSLDGTEFPVDQREGVLIWNALGEIELTVGMHAVTLTNRGQGRLSADAVKLTDQDGAELILDDWQDTNRNIAYLDGDSLTLIDGESYTAEFDCRLYVFHLQIHRGYDGSTIDCLNRRVSDLFYDYAWKPHLERLSEYMGAGKAINGIFSDHEGDYGFKLAWSEDLATYFTEKYGEDIRRILPLLIDRDTGGQDVVWRYRWFDAVSDIYVAHFHKLSAKAAEKDLYFTMHTWEESLQLQACLVGDVFKLNRGISLPGTDALCCVAYNPQNFKDHFSITEFEGTRFMNEVMALTGLEKYTPDELKKQGNYLATYGVSHVINHAVKMTRPKAQEVVTPDFYNIDPCWQAMGQYTDFVRRFSYINSNGHAHATTLVLSPMDSMFALAENDVFSMDYEMLDVGGGIPRVSSSFGGEAGEINREYGELIRILTRCRVEHLTADKEYIHRMTVQDGMLSYKDFTFRTVIVPRTVILDLPVAQKLAAFAESGGRIIWVGNLPSATLQNGRNDPALAEQLNRIARSGNLTRVDTFTDSVCTPDVEITEGCNTLLSHRRIIDGKHFVFICHNADTAVTSTVRLPDVQGKAILLDPATGEQRIPEAHKTAEGLCVTMNFQPFGAYYLIVDPLEDPATPADAPAYRELSLTEFTAEIDKGNREASLVHDFAPMITDRVRVILRKGCFEDPTHPDVTHVEVVSANETVLCHAVNETFTVEYDDVKAVEISFPLQSIDAVRVSSERGLTSYRIEAWEESWWRTVAELDTYSQSEVNHPIAYPDGVYDVKLTDFSMWDFLPDNFAGVVTYRTAVMLDQKPAESAVLELDKLCGSVSVTINGVPVGIKMFAPFTFDVGQALREGKNEIELRVSNTIVCNHWGKHGGISMAVLKY